jgi:hypothetical protein
VNPSPFAENCCLQVAQVSACLFTREALPDWSAGIKRWRDKFCTTNQKSRNKESGPQQTTHWPRDHRHRSNNKYNSRDLYDVGSTGDRTVFAHSRRLQVNARRRSPRVAATPTSRASKGSKQLSVRCRWVSAVFFVLLHGIFLRRSALIPRRTGDGNSQAVVGVVKVTESNDAATPAAVQMSPPLVNTNH